MSSGFPSLPENNTVKRTDFAGRPLLVVFMCNHCPFVKHIADALARFADEYQRKGLAIVGINANDVNTVPQDSPDNMSEEAEARGYSFPYLYDETQDVAKAYGAACTPDFFLFDNDHNLVCRGQFNETRPQGGEPTGKDLRKAADAVLEGEAPRGEQKPSMGCNIKWKPGDAPGQA